MAENILVVMNKEDLQPLANDIKTLNGLSQSNLITLNEMEKAIEDTNDAVDSQENLIAQISAALEGKAAGGGGSSLTIGRLNFDTQGDGWGQFIAIEYRDGNMCPIVDFTSNHSGVLDWVDIVMGTPIIIMGHDYDREIEIDGTYFYREDTDEGCGYTIISTVDMGVSDDIVITLY